MTTSHRSWWRNCALEADSEILDIDRMEDDIAPLSFQQNLCSWGKRFPVNANVTGMFQYTNCSNTSVPIQQVSRYDGIGSVRFVGPWCYDCEVW